VLFSPVTFPSAIFRALMICSFSISNNVLNELISCSVLLMLSFIKFSNVRFVPCEVIIALFNLTKHHHSDFKLSMLKQLHLFRLGLFLLYGFNQRSRNFFNKSWYCFTFYLCIIFSLCGVCNKQLILCTGKRHIKKTPLFFNIRILSEQRSNTFFCPGNKHNGKFKPFGYIKSVWYSG